MHKIMVLFATVMLGLRFESQSQREFMYVRSLFVLSFLGRGLATLLFPIQIICKSWKTVKIASLGPHWPVVSHIWIEDTVLCTYLCQPTFISCLSLLMCGFVCHGVEVTLWSRYLLENLIGCPLVGMHCLELKGSVPYSSINPTNAHWNLKKNIVLYCSCIAYYHVCIILPLAPMQPERSSAISSILLLSSCLSLCLQTVSFLQGFLPNFNLV
jgi:hypothetical protein